MKQLKGTRKRGLVLTPTGLQRLQAAILAVEKVQNRGDRFTLKDLRVRMNVSTKTLSRLWSLNTGVDQKTLKLCFSAFNLELRSEDYAILSEPNETEGFKSLPLSLNTKEINFFEPLYLDSFVTKNWQQLENLWSYPDGPVPLDSPFYIDRPPIEELVYREVTQPGSAIWIRAPKEMGKSSLVLRLLTFAQTQGYRTVNLNFNQIDASCLTDLNKLLRCICWRLATELGIDPKLDNKWDEEIGCKLSCTLYLQSYLLQQVESPVVFVLNEIDTLFEHPEIAQEFFACLRSWYEAARQNTNLQKLRLVVAYSTEVYVYEDINHSPLNIGLPIRLGEFTKEQVKYLARRHGLNWSSSEEVRQLMSLVGGHPALIRIGLYHLSCQRIALENLVKEAMANGGIYRHHLWRHWAILQENPNLAKAYFEIVLKKQSVSINPIDAHKLESLGLIRYESDRILSRCELYRIYFQKQLSTILK
ncbi:MAG: AAA-like domain-containing protein [Nostoc sp. ChiSLP02]|nr:AAA-like domain-containing protein [Nostoc sp. DedSLP05]MDZ8099798.1 AAA-like domain-containing protein [Nostoc sp. DedSLP01]MDZ8186874.1 AAA-like domain-containing protein [Nostoc sp. ChiSLP02]